VAAAHTARAGEAVGQDAAREIVSESPVEIAGDPITLSIVPQCQIEKGFQMLPRQALQEWKNTRIVLHEF
jgi:hypothetical protein